MAAAISDAIDDHNNDEDAHGGVIAGKLDTDGDGSAVTVEFEQAATRANILSTESLGTIFGKIKKWFADLGTAGFQRCRERKR